MGQMPASQQPRRVSAGQLRNEPNNLLAYASGYNPSRKRGDNYQTNPSLPTQSRDHRERSAPGRKENTKRTQQSPYAVVTTPSRKRGATTKRTQAPRNRAATTGSGQPWEKGNYETNPTRIDNRSITAPREISCPATAVSPQSTSSHTRSSDRETLSPPNRTPRSPYRAVSRPDGKPPPPTLSHAK
jgi:hypothetical protein